MSSTMKDFKIGDVIITDYWGDVFNGYDKMAKILELPNYNSGYSPNKDINGGNYGGNYGGNFTGPKMSGTIIKIHDNRSDIFYALRLSNGQDVFFRNDKRNCEILPLKLPDNLFEL